MAKLRDASFRTQACIYFKDENDRFHACMRDVSKKILEAMAGMTKLPGASFRSRARIHFKKGNDSFRACEPDVSKKILEAMASGDSIGIVTFANEIHRTRNFKYDLKSMTLRSLTTGEKEDILIEFPWDPKCLISIVGNGDKNLKRQLLMVALDRIRKRASLRKILTMKSVPESCKIRENPYLFSAHPPYYTFVESLYNFLEEKTRSQGTNLQPTLLEKFLDCASEGATSDTFAAIERENIRMVFHGTNPAVMDAILFSGLKPEYRLYSGKDRDFFSITYEESSLHTKYRMMTRSPDTAYRVPESNVKALLFMVINSTEVRPESTDSFNDTSRSVHSNECELALAEITPTTRPPSEYK